MIRSFARKTDGAAALEFAMWLAILTLPLLNAVDLGFYAFQSMQVRESAQSAVVTALKMCGGTISPVSANCSNFNTRLTTALQSTSLGSKITWSSGSEGWDCVGASTTPTLSQATGTHTETIAPSGSNSGSMESTATCTNGNGASDVVTITVTYTYTPLFPNVTVTSLLNTTVSKTVSMRVG